MTRGEGDLNPYNLDTVDRVVSFTHVFAGFPRKNPNRFEEVKKIN